MENNIKYKYVEDLIKKKNQHIRPPLGTGYRGVHRDNRPNSPNKYRATFAVKIDQNKIELYLGSYNTPEEAYIARIKFIDSLK